MYYKYGTIYREVIHVRPFELCQLVNLGTSNLLTKFVLNLMDESAPGFIHPCPYKKVNVSHVMIKTSTVGSAFASGDYKVIFITSDAKKTLAGSVLLYLSINSTDKNSFG